MTLDSYGRMRRCWWPKRIQCRDRHPGGMVCCDLEVGHNGDHMDHYLSGGVRTVWSGDVDVPDITVLPEEVEAESALEWAKSQNPKMYKSSDRQVASEKCLTASKEKHQTCTEPWCECPCHDEEDIRKRAVCAECGHPLTVRPFHKEGCSKRSRSRMSLG